MAAMSWGGFAAVGIGAAIGAWLRWWVGNLMNPVLPHLPLGTLAVNVAGGYLVGLAIAYFSQHAAMAPEARLFVITGFLGGLTTFSTFSAESVLLVQTGQPLWALAHSALHLVGSVVATFLGVASWRVLH